MIKHITTVDVPYGVILVEQIKVVEQMDRCKTH